MFLVLEKLYLILKWFSFKTVDLNLLLSFLDPFKSVLVSRLLKTPKQVKNIESR